MWDGKHLFVCARKAELKDGMLEFVYILSGREWTWQKRLEIPKYRDVAAWNGGGLLRRDGTAAA